VRKLVRPLWQIDAKVCPANFFNKMTRPELFRLIHHLILLKNGIKVGLQLLSRLRNTWQYCIPLAHTEKFKKSLVRPMRCVLSIWTLMTILMTILLTFSFI